MSAHLPEAPNVSVRTETAPPATTSPSGSAGEVLIQSSMFGPRRVGLTPLPTGPFGVVFAAPRTEIAATVEQVWAVLRDLDRYPEWNPLNRFVRPTTTDTRGAKLLLGISWGPYNTDAGPIPVQNLALSLTNTEMLSVDQPPSALGWADSWHRWIHRAERMQYLTPLPNGHTLYRSEEVMVGLLSPLIGWLYRDRIVQGFAATAIALKRRVEGGVKRNAV